MKKPWRSRAWRRSAVIAFTVALTLGGGHAAQANTSGSITASVNSSDPELIQCPNSAGTGMTLCLFTSLDMGNQPVPSGQNYYPMNQTMLWRLKDGADASKPANWVNQGAVLQESSLTSRGVPSGANHLWAPGVRYWNGKYYLYVPDVLDINDESHSSRIFLFTTTTANGASGYAYVGRVSTPTAPNAGYASDPMLFVDTHANPYLVYANGDNSNCGGLSIGLLSPTAMTTFAGAAHEITINGFSGLGSLAAACTSGHPYLEGAALYHWTEVGAPVTLPFLYVLMFAAKPTSTPSGCSTANEVIAYATSSFADGPYDYQGIIMCGSSSEWTNQASVVKHTANNGKYLFAWHDGGGTTHNRRTHLLCLRWGTDGKVVPIARSSANLSNCP
jgi:hypothetical protein